MRYLVKGMTVLATTTAAFAILILGVLGLGQAIGYQSLTVMSGSMEPAIHVGDLVITRQIAPLRARKGDVITFRDPQDNSRLITHRVQSVKLVGIRARFVTKGDANTGVERWNISLDGTIGLVSYHVVGAGYVLVWVRSPLGRLALIILPALLLGGAIVYRVWRPETEERPANELAY